MEIQEKTKLLLDLRSKINGLMETMDVLKAERDSLQISIMGEMSELGFNSVKIGDTMVSKAVRKTLQITDEKELIAELDKKGLKNEYVREQIDKELWRGLSTKLAKEGQIYKGTEIKETEFISIRNVKPLNK